MVITMTDEYLLTVAEVATRLRLNPETVRRWLKTGRMHGHQLPGGRGDWRIPESEIRRVLTEGTARPDDALSARTPQERERWW
jgi:excisionase family DNA binding protein